MSDIIQSLHKWFASYAKTCNAYHLVYKDLCIRDPLIKLVVASIPHGKVNRLLVSGKIGSQMISIGFRLLDDIVSSNIFEHMFKGSKHA